MDPADFSCNADESPDKSLSDEAQLLLSSLNLTVSEDAQRAFLAGRARTDLNVKIIQEAITHLIKSRGICHGLRVEAVKQAIEKLNKGDALKDFLIARGIPVKPGREALVEYNFDPEPHRVGKMTEAGYIDFRDKGPLPLAEPGDLLASLTPAVQGGFGKNIYGQLMEPEPVKELTLKAGKGVELSQDALSVTAKVQGMATSPAPGLFEVQEVLEIKGDVNPSVGHINFPGLVRVSGSVQNDMKVKAKYLEVNELEPESIIEVGRDLTVLRGVMGSHVKVGGKICARFIRGSEVTCGGDCIVETEIVQAKIQADGMILVVGGEGRVANSVLSAMHGVTAYELVSSGKETSRVFIGVRPEVEKQYQTLLRAYEALKIELDSTRTKIKNQKQELEETEEELRAILKENQKLGDEDEALRENLLAQIEMIKPIRESLHTDIKTMGQRLVEMQGRMNKLERQYRAVDAKIPKGTVWLDIIHTASANTVIQTPNASLKLEDLTRGFSAREVSGEGRALGKHEIKIGDLRSSLPKVRS